MKLWGGVIGVIVLFGLLMWYARWDGQCCDEDSKCCGCCCRRQNKPRPGGQRRVATAAQSVPVAQIRTGIVTLPQLSRCCSCHELMQLGVGLGSMSKGSWQDMVERKRHLRRVLG